MTAAFDDNGEFDIPDAPGEFDLDASSATSVDEPAPELSAALDQLVEQAVMKCLQKEADGIAEAKWHEMLTPELYRQLEEAASRRLLAQVDSTLAEPEAPEAEPEPQLVFGSVEQFVREKLAPSYRREVIEGTSRNWCPQWWRHAEAISRLEALWRAWEHLRQDPATGMSVWWRDHADHHMAVLFDPDGPFKTCSVRDGHSKQDFEVVPLPIDPAPASMFPDMRTDDGSQPDQ